MPIILRSTRNLMGGYLKSAFRLYTTMSLILKADHLPLLDQQLSQRRVFTIRYTVYHYNHPPCDLTIRRRDVSRPTGRTKGFDVANRMLVRRTVFPVVLLLRLENEVLLSNVVFRCLPLFPLLLLPLPMSTLLTLLLS